MGSTIQNRSIEDVSTSLGSWNPFGFWGPFGFWNPFQLGCRSLANRLGIFRTAIIIFLSIFAGHVRASGDPSRDIIYASPTGSGSECSAPKPCTLEDAKLKAQSVLRVFNLTSPRSVTVALAAGTYFLNRPLNFGPDDSAVLNYEIRYKSASPGAAILSGAVPVPNWTLYNAALNIWSAPVPQSVVLNRDTKTMSRGFYINGKRAERARLSINPIESGMPNLGAVTLSPNGGGYLVNLSGMSDWHNKKDIEIVALNAWSMIRCPLDSIAAHEIIVQPLCWDRVKNLPTAQYGFGLNWLENNLAFLSEPGQWYLDQAARKIYYKPRATENMSNMIGELAITEQLIVINGASNLVFDGLVFEKTNWYGYRNSDPDNPYVGYTPLQSGENSILRQEPRAAIEITKAQKISIENSQFKNLGGSALSVLGGSSDISIQHNEFVSVAATGLQVGSPREIRQTNPQIQNSKIMVQDNLFKDMANEFWDNASIMIFALRDSSIIHNEIANCPWSCLAIGWGWGKVDTYNRNVLIANNHIHNGMQRLFDGGGIYTNGKTQGGMEISTNVIEQIGNIGLPLCNKSYWSKGFQGIYHDQGTNIYHDHDNLVMNIVPAEILSRNTDGCRGNWMKINDQMQLIVTKNATDYDHVTISARATPAPGCSAGDTVTHCIPGESDNLITPHLDTSQRARSIRTHAGRL